MIKTFIAKNITMVICLNNILLERMENREFQVLLQ